ncbi:MAG: hypothetical protein IPK71_16865 [Myxococcales bacterium]|nr:hypothetical protein [Myxococcales bacterium]
MRALRAPLLLATLAFGCRPDLDEGLSRLDSPRVVAVVLDPPEAPPGATVRVSPVIASRDGIVEGTAVELAFCALPRALGENGAAPASCLRDDGVLAGSTSSGEATLVVPREACLTFGPEVTSADLRPRDADVTGGHYQPLRVRGADTTTFASLRLTCAPARVPAEVAARLGRLARPNENPTGLRLEPLGDTLARRTLRRGARVPLRASWEPTSAEAYVAVPPSGDDLVTRREALRVTWYASAGTLSHERTGRASNDTASTSDNDLLAPEAPGVVHLVAVLRDDRGGVAVTTLSLGVE